MDIEVSPLLVLEPSLMDSCPLLLPLISSWNLNSSLEEATSKLLGSDITLLEFIFSDKKEEERNFRGWNT